MTSSADALQSGQRLPCSTKLNIPSSELQTYLWRVSPSWEHVQPGLAAVPPHTCPNTHLLCITETQQVGLVWISATARGGFPLWESLLAPLESQGGRAGVLAPLGVPLME